MGFVRATDLAIAENEVALAVQHGAFGSHVGLVFNSAKEGKQLLHLRFHKDLAVEGFPDGRCWIAAKSQVPPIASKHLTGIIRSIAKKKPEIAYGLNFIAAKGSFSPNGAYKPPRGSDGLTCATFVSEVYRISSIPLLNEDTWPATEENKAWAAKVYALLQQKGADAEHLRRVERNITGLRIRPEEVATAAEKPTKPPYLFNAASVGGKEVMDVLQKECQEQRRVAVVPNIPIFGAQAASPSTVVPFGLPFPQRKD